MAEDEKVVTKTTYCECVTAIDPDTNGDVEIEVHKDPVTKGLIGIDASFLDQVAVFIPSPFNSGHILDLSADLDEEDVASEYDPADFELDDEYPVCTPQTIFCGNITVTDPDDGRPTVLQIHKDPSGNSMFAVDDAQVKRLGTIMRSPFNPKKHSLVLSQAA